MSSVGPLDFGGLIAYLLPGFVSFYGLHYVSRATKHLVTLSLAKDTGLGVELAIVLFSLTAGMIVSGLRSLVLDRLQHLAGVTPLSPAFDKLKDDKTLKAYEAAVTNVYRFAQFYGNMFIALLFLGAMRTIAGGFEFNIVSAIMIVALLVLLAAHNEQLRKTHAAVTKILT